MTPTGAASEAEIAELRAASLREAVNVAKMFANPSLVCDTVAVAALLDQLAEARNEAREASELSSMMRDQLTMAQDELATSQEREAALVERVAELSEWVEHLQTTVLAREMARDALKAALASIRDAKAFGADADSLDDLIRDIRQTARTALLAPKASAPKEEQEQGSSRSQPVTALLGAECDLSADQLDKGRALVQQALDKGYGLRGALDGFWRAMVESKFERSGSLLTWTREGDRKPVRDAMEGEQWLLTYCPRTGTYDTGCIDGNWTHGEVIDVSRGELWAWLPVNPENDLSDGALGRQDGPASSPGMNNPEKYIPAAPKEEEGEL